MAIKSNIEDSASIDPDSINPGDEDAPGDEYRSGGSPPALTIQIQSWATPVIGVVMLLVGLLGGYFLRPVLADRIAAGSTPQAAVQPPSGTTSPAQADTSTDQETPDLMAFLVGETHHFLGDANAPVTMIEFSDFQ